MLSHVRLFVAPWTVDHQALLSTESSRKKYWSGLPFPAIFPTQGLSLHLFSLLLWQVSSLPLVPPEAWQIIGNDTLHLSLDRLNCVTTCISSV